MNNTDKHVEVIQAPAGDVAATIEIVADCSNGGPLVTFNGYIQYDTDRPVCVEHRQFKTVRGARSKAYRFIQGLR